MNKTLKSRIAVIFMIVLAALTAAFLPGAVSTDHGGPTLFFTDTSDVPVSYVVLPNVGDSVQLRVAAHEIGVGNSDTVGVRLVHDDTVSMNWAGCVGMYAGALGNSTIPPGGGTYGVCTLIGGGPLLDSGGVMEFTVTRQHEGDFTLLLSDVPEFETAFLKNGIKFINMDPPIIVDISATLDVLSVEPTPTPGFPATPEPTVEATPTTAPPPPPPPLPATATPTPTPTPSGPAPPPLSFEPPTVPLNFVGTPGLRSITLTWNAPAQTSGRPIDVYSIQNLKTGVIATVPGNLLSYTFVDLNPALEYSFTVKASTGLGESPTAGFGPIKPWAAPGAPTNVTASIGSDGSSVAISWNAPASNGGTPITGYTVTISTTGEVIETTTTQLALPALLNPGDNVTLDVRAVTATGSGQPANASVAHAQAAAPTHTPAPTATALPTATPGNSPGVPSVINTSINGTTAELDQLQSSFTDLFGEDVQVTNDPISVQSENGQVSVKLGLGGVKAGSGVAGSVAIHLGNLNIDTVDGDGTGTIALDNNLSVEGDVNLATEDDAVVAKFSNTKLVYAPQPSTGPVGNLTSAKVGFKVDVNNVANGASLSVTYARSVEELAAVSGAVFELAASGESGVDPETDIAFVVNVSKTGITNNDLGTNEATMTVDLAWYEARVAEGKSIVITKVGDDGVSHTVEATCELQGSVVLCTAVFAGDAGGFSLFALVAMVGTDSTENGENSGSGSSGSETGGTGVQPTPTTGLPAPVATELATAPTLAPDEQVSETPDPSGPLPAVDPTPIPPTANPVSVPTPTPDLSDVQDTNVLPGLDDNDDGSGGVPLWVKILIVLVAAPAIMRAVMVFIAMKRKSASTQSL